MNYLVTGTDTDVGKTYIASRLIRALRAQGRDCIGMKPWCCGSLDDVTELQAASDFGEPENAINPVFFRTPAAPYAASMIEGRIIDLAQVEDVFRPLTARHDDVLVEGAGGLLVPILRDFDYRDLAVAWDLAVVVVAPNRLGTLNHTRLTIEALRARKVRCCGVVLNSLEASDAPDRVTNRSVLELLVDVPVFPVEFRQTDLRGCAENLGMFRPGAGI